MTTVTTTSDHLLRGALWANAVFSMISGIVATVFAVPIADFMEVPAVALVVVGVGTILFAVSIWFNARRDQISHTEAKLTVVADMAWVVAAAILIFAFPEAMSDGGKVLLGIVSVVVAVFAVLQWLGLRQVGGTA